MTRALAEQDTCAATRASLTGSVRDRFLSAQLDTAAGNFDNARSTLSSVVEEVLRPVDGGVDPSLSSALEFLELLERLEGNVVHAAELDARGLALRERRLVPEPFDEAVIAFNTALGQKDPTRALEAWADTLTSLATAAGPRHALVKVAFDRRAALLESQGKAAEARRDRERAAELAKSAWCR